MLQPNQLAATVNAFNRKAPTLSAAPGGNVALGPLAALVTGNTWVGNTGYNLMVVPSPLSTNGFIVLISQLFETHVFEEVPAAVPNRSQNNGTEQIGAVKYSQTVAENVTKNILHEETGMWLNQTVGTNPPTTPSNGLEAVNGTLNGMPAVDYVTTNPVIRSGTVPHGNTFQAAGVWNNFPSPPFAGGFNPLVSGNVAPYLQLPNFPTVSGQLSFLPTYADGSDPTDLQAAYMTELTNAIARVGALMNANDFINPIGFLNAYANNISNIVSMPVTTTGDLGAVINIPFEKAVAGPQDFICTFLIETISDAGAVGPTTDQVPAFYQLQYLTSIPLLFPSGYKGKAVLFPHWNLNTLIAI